MKFYLPWSNGNMWGLLVYGHRSTLYNIIYSWGPVMVVIILDSTLYDKDFQSDLRQVGGFLQVLPFPPRCNWKIVESGVKPHNPERLWFYYRYLILFFWCFSGLGYQQLQVICGIKSTYDPLHPRYYNRCIQRINNIEIFFTLFWLNQRLSLQETHITVL